MIKQRYICDMCGKEDLKQPFSMTLEIPTRVFLFNDNEDEPHDIIDTTHKHDYELCRKCVVEIEKKLKRIGRLHPEVEA